MEYGVSSNKVQSLGESVQMVKKNRFRGMPDVKRVKAEFPDYQSNGITRLRMQVDSRVQKHMYRPLVLDGRCSSHV
jgi:hypothetical protein